MTTNHSYIIVSMLLDDADKTIAEYNKVLHYDCIDSDCTELDLCDQCAKKQVRSVLRVIRLYTDRKKIHDMRKEEHRKMAAYRKILMELHQHIRNFLEL